MVENKEGEDPEGMSLSPSSIGRSTRQAARGGQGSSMEKVSEPSKKLSQADDKKVASGMGNGKRGGGTEVGTVLSWLMGSREADPRPEPPPRAASRTISPPPRPIPSRREGSSPPPPLPPPQKAHAPPIIHDCAIQGLQQQWAGAGAEAGQSHRGGTFSSAGAARIPQLQVEGRVSFVEGLQDDAGGHDGRAAMAKPRSDDAYLWVGDRDEEEDEERRWNTTPSHRHARSADAAGEGTDESDLSQRSTPGVSFLGHPHSNAGCGSAEEEAAAAAAKGNAREEEEEEEEQFLQEIIQRERRRRRAAETRERILIQKLSEAHSIPPLTPDPSTSLDSLLLEMRLLRSRFSEGGQRSEVEALRRENRRLKTLMADLVRREVEDEESLMLVDLEAQRRRRRRTSVGRSLPPGGCEAGSGRVCEEVMSTEGRVMEGDARSGGEQAVSPRKKILEWLSQEVTPPAIPPRGRKGRGERGAEEIVMGLRREVERRRREVERRREGTMRGLDENLAALRHVKEGPSRVKEGAGGRRRGKDLTLGVDEDLAALRQLVWGSTTVV